MVFSVSSEAWMARCFQKTSGVIRVEKCVCAISLKEYLVTQEVEKRTT